jgi:hypothetical protein
MTGSRTAVPRGRHLLVAVLVTLVALAAHVVGATPAAAQQTFGGDPLDRIREAAARYGDDCADVSRRLPADKLAALVIAPTFPETGAPSDRAPSPMTLSRYDTNANLYSWGDPTTWPKAFWTPGIGAWQWDDASLLGLAASQRIDQAFVVDHTTEFIAKRWCDGRGLDTVWVPWHGCGSNRCRTIYEAIYQGGTLVNITRDDLVTRFGGMERRTCTVDGGSSFTCWFVDPARAEGYSGFAVSGFGPSPVPAPFYTFRVDGYEERHFLAAHTGYDRDIRARLLSGRNSRTEGALDWTTGSGLCDVTAGIGDCQGFVVRDAFVRGSYEPLAGDFDGDGFDDVLWYGAGSLPDGLWFGQAVGFDVSDTRIRGVYDPAVGDFDGDGHDDIVWYGPGAGKDSVWWGRTEGWGIRQLDIDLEATPVVGDFDGNGRDDILWYVPGPTPDPVWSWSSRGTITTSVNSVRGTNLPLVGDFDGVGGDDILWYGPGDAYDSLWLNDASGMPADIRGVRIRGVYQPVVGDFHDDGRDDVLWYGPGGGYDSLWRSTGGGFAYDDVKVDVVATPFVGDFDGAGGDDVFFHVPGPDPDPVWYSNP